MRTYKKELIISIIFIALSLYLLFALNNIKTTSGQGVSAVFWPRIIIILMLILSIVNLVQITVKKTEIIAKLKEKRKQDPDEIKSNIHKFYYSMAILIAYVSLLNRMGFVFLTPFFLMALFWALGYRKKILVPILAFSIVIVLSYLFPNQLNLLLPRGQGFFREFSYIFY